MRPNVRTFTYSKHSLELSLSSPVQSYSVLNPLAPFPRRYLLANACSMVETLNHTKRECFRNLPPCHAVEPLACALL